MVTGQEFAEPLVPGVDTVRLRIDVPEFKQNGLNTAWEVELSLVGGS